MTIKAQIDPLEALEAQEADILLKLSLLSDANSANYDKEGSRGALDSKPPPGFNEARGRARLSLWAYHTTQLANARQKGLSARHTALGEAYRDHEIAKRRPPDYFGPDSDANRRARDEAILAWRGKRAEWVAAVEGCSHRHVCRLRKKEGLNQTTGEPDDRNRTGGGVRS